VNSTLTSRVRALFLSRPNEWVDGRELATVGGYAAWRTRLSECRREYGMTIENQQIRHPEYTVSRYKYTPKDAQ
jgi:hypothetical protein